MVQSIKESLFKRPFGQIPEWAKQGPVTIVNYDFRAEAYGAKAGLGTPGNLWPFLSRRGEHPSTANEIEWELYFRDHLRGFPPSYRLYRDGILSSWNAPAIEPNDFDPTYVRRERDLG